MKKFRVSSFKYLKVQYYYYRCLSGQKWDMSEPKYVWLDNFTGASQEIIYSPELKEKYCWHMTALETCGQLFTGEAHVFKQQKETLLDRPVYLLSEPLINA